MSASAGEVYTVYNRYPEHYTTRRVVYIASSDNVSSQSRAVILPPSWVGDAPLIAEELSHLRPLYKDLMYWPRELHLLWVPVEIPPQYTLVGILPSFVDKPYHSYGRWDNGYEVHRQTKQQEILEERRRAFKEAIESDGEAEIGGKPVKVSSH